MDIFKKINELNDANKPFVLATIIKVTGSTPGKVGFKMIVDKDNTFGTVGGGAIEVEVINEARSKLSGGSSEVKEYLLTDNNISIDDSIKKVPMSCNGTVSVFYEAFNSLPPVYVFGGGHVGSALLYFLKPLPFHKILIDNRPEFASKDKNPYADEIVHLDYLEYVKSFNPPPNSFIVVLTHKHLYDYDIVNIIYTRKINVKYIGVIASKSKSASLKEKLLNEVGKNLDISNLYSPVGLMLGGNSAEEIALDIAAQILNINYK